MVDPAAAVKPMLATAAPAGQPAEALLNQFDSDWVFEPKLDGFRCLMHVGNGAVTLRSRTGADISQRFLATPLPNVDGPLVVDGELIALDDLGRPSFNLVQRANGRSGDPTASYVAFDLLYHPELLDVRHMPWVRRRELLEALPAEGLSVLPYSASGSAIWETVVAQGMEGAIAKRSGSTYRSGRSRDWVKLKRLRGLSAIVTGFNPGEGGRADSFGSLSMALSTAAGDLIPIGDVGTGFNQADLTAVRSIQPPFVIEVQFQEWTGSALRMPVFKGVREDIAVTDCTFEKQLPESAGG